MAQLKVKPICTPTTWAVNGNKWVSISNGRVIHVIRCTVCKKPFRYTVGSICSDNCRRSRRMVVPMNRVI